MKKLFLSAAVALCAVAANAAIEDVRIYINPGHGSWTSNDRPCGTVKHGAYVQSDQVDTTGFFETNTNLKKAFALFHKLKEMGVKHNGANALDLTQNIVMSHIQAGPYPPYTSDGAGGWVKDPSTEFNRNLSEVAAEVVFNNFDMFVSIHSNANSDGDNVNYPLFLYRGTDAQEGAAGSIAMSKACWPHLYSLSHNNWSATGTYNMTKTNIRGDQNFYSSQSKSWVGYDVPDDYVYDESDPWSKFEDGKVSYYGYLGALKHGTPGFLVEGYFHTYQPARHRYMNPDVCYLEGLAYAAGINDYFGWGYEEKNAVIYGILRDMDEKFSHTYYNASASTNDKYLPLNNATVKLLDASGNEVATYTTDDEYNGAFVFHVEPGTYSLSYSLEGYLEAEAEYTEQFTVAAGGKYLPEVFLRNENWTPPTIVYVNYPDSTAGKAGYNLLPKYETKATAYNLLATQLEGKTVRRQLLRDDKLYVLALDSSNEPYVYIADIAGNTVITLGTSAATGDIYKVSDIALTADGYLIGINKANQAYNGAKNIKGYKWEKDATTGLPTGELSVWWTNNFAGNYTAGIGGESLTYNGTLEDGKLIYTATTTGSGGNSRLVICSILEGEYQTYYRNNQDGTYIKTGYLGETYEITLSPRADDQIVFNSAKVQPFEIKLNTADAGVPTILAHMSGDALAKASAGESYFKYAGRDLMVAPKVNAEGLVEGIQLFDITDGLDAAKEIAVDAAFEPVTYTYASAHGELALTLDAEGNTTGANIELFLAVDGKVTKFTVSDLYDSANLAKNTITGTANPFAYALKGSVANEVLSVSYTLNVDAADVKIIVKDAEGNEVAISEEGAQVAGEHTASVTLDNLELGSYTWEVEVAGAEKATIERFCSMNFYHPSGIEVDNSMESPSFGTIFVCEAYNQGKTSNSTGTYVSAQTGGAFGGGLYIFTPQVKEVALTESTSTFVMTQVLNKDGGARFYPSWMTNKDNAFGSSTAKTCGADFNEVQVSEDGRIFVSRYNFSGDCYLVAESLEKLVEDGEFTSLLAGKTMTNGIYFDESGNYLAGPAQSFDVKGSGDDLKLLALSRADNSIDAGGGKNYVLEYDLGSASALSTPTAFAALDKKYTAAYDRKTNIQYDNKGGVWYCQYRGTPSNAEPALVYVDANGEIKYFEGTGGKARYQGALAIDPCNDRIAAASASGVVSVYEIITLEDGTVVLNELYRLTHNMGGSAYSASFDTAGNLYLGNASNEVVQGYALPRTEAAVTKAASKYAFEMTDNGAVGIESIEAENAPAVYYNLQGVRVDNPANGVYIVKRGNKVTKEYIRK